MTSPKTTATTTATPPWGTLEELLLACAVHRYGTNSWDSISKALQNHTTFSLLTPNLCQQRYHDLKKRFRNASVGTAVETAGDGGDEVEASGWVDELRRLRVAELRRDLQRYDHSIVSLQLKVKKLREEGENDEIKPELDDSDPKNQQKELETETVNIKSEPDPDPNSQTEPDPVEPVNEEAEADSAELVDSVRENSDVQSTASLYINEINNNNNNDNNNNDDNNNKNEIYYDRRGKINSGSNSSGEENETSSFKGSDDDGKSQPLVEFLDVVRSRKLAVYFQRRLESQDTPNYRNLIRQHIDLDIIQKKLEEGQYTDCHTDFYRDLTLLISNAIIFFGERSSEHKAALELRQLLNKQFQSHLSSPPDLKSHLSKPTGPEPISKKPITPEPNQADDPTDLKPKLTITGPVIACRKRSSITGKSSRTGGERKELMSDKPLALELKKQVEKVSSKSLNSMTKKGSRSSSSKSNNNNSSNTIPKAPINSGKAESSEPKGDGKKPIQGNNTLKLKQWLGSGKNKLLESLKNSDRSERRKDEASLSKLVKEKAKERVERERPGNRSNRGPPPKRVVAATSGKRSRNGGGEVESQSRKRQRK